MRHSLSLDDNYTLIQFARRAVVRALNDSSPEPLELGLTALAMIDEARIDPRDATWAVGLWNHAAERWPDAAPGWRDRAASLATARMGEIVRSSSGSLSDWGYREINGRDGTGLIRSGWARYAPSIDLVALADRLIGRALKARYVCEIEVATEIPVVWFDGKRREHAAQALERALGVAAVRGTLRGAATQSAGQMFVMWLAEMPSQTDCEELAADVGSGVEQDGRFVVATFRNSVFALCVAGSVQQGVEPHESMASLRAIAEKTKEVLLMLS